MPRKRPEPFWREQTRCYYVQLGKRQIRLSPDEDEAWRLYHEIMARPPEQREPQPTTSGTALEVIELFLEWASKNRERLTYEAYRRRLQCLADSVPADLPCDALKPYHVTRVMDAKDWNANTKNDFATAVQRALNWAVSQGIIERNPIASMDKPARRVRELVISPKEYAAIMEAVKEPRFRELLEFAWETGARVQELRRIEAEHVDIERSRIVLPPSKAKGKRGFRVIYLNDRAREMVASMPRSGFLLLNSEGKPWTKDAINCAFCRLEKRLGKKYHLGAFRKGYATEALKAGVDTVTLGHLMGHADASMISKVYGRVQQDPKHMADAANRAKAVKAGEGA